MSNCETLVCMHLGYGPKEFQCMIVGASTLQNCGDSKEGTWQVAEDYELNWNGHAITERGNGDEHDMNDREWVYIL